MFLFLPLTLFITAIAFPHLNAMSEAKRWAQQVCTEQLFKKAGENRFAKKKVNRSTEAALFQETPCGTCLYPTHMLDHMEIWRLHALKKNSAWSFMLYKELCNTKKSIIRISEADWKSAQVNAGWEYLQIIAWAFGPECEEFIALNGYHWAYNPQTWEYQSLFFKKYPNLYMDNGKPLLFRMMHEKKIEIVQELIACGANRYAKSVQTGDTMLHELSSIYFKNDLDTAKKFYNDIISLFPAEYLITTNSAGKTPWNKAIDQGNFELMAVLSEY